MQEEFFKNSPEATNVNSYIAQILEKTGWKQKIRNEVYNKLRHKNAFENTCFGQDCDPCVAESIGFIRATQRTISEQKELAMRWNNLRSQELAIKDIRPVYDHTDFLLVILRLIPPDVSGFKLEEDISNHFNLPNDNWRSDLLSTGLKSLWKDVRAEEIEEIAKKVLQLNDTPVLAEFLKSRCPPSQRSTVWSAVLGISITDAERLYYEKLQEAVFQLNLIVDHLMQKEVKLTTGNSDHYFVFEDLIHQTMLIFSRDSNIWKSISRYSCFLPVYKTESNPKRNQQELQIYPPSGIIPCHGFSFFVSPICYMDQDPVIVYFIFREMYLRYFFHLHNISSNNKGIVSLCLLFEKIMQNSEPDLVELLAIKRIKLLNIAFKWLMRAFSGFLGPSQLLILWDKIIAYDSLEFLPLLAVSIILDKKDCLMETTNADTAEILYADISSVEVDRFLKSILK
ncbi:TBC1 domain family member 19 [Nymphon striatum]|nr:TBC1 domain family member 19 [Nymphon striatum]